MYTPGLRVRFLTGAKGLEFLIVYLLQPVLFQLCYFEKKKLLIIAKLTYFDDFGVCLYNRGISLVQNFPLATAVTPVAYPVLDAGDLRQLPYAAAIKALGGVRVRLSGR